MESLFINEPNDFQIAICNINQAEEKDHPFLTYVSGASLQNAIWKKTLSKEKHQLPAMLSLEDNQEEYTKNANALMAILSVNSAKMGTSLVDIHNLL